MEVGHSYSNGVGTRLVWYILSFFGAVILGIAGFIISNISNIHAQLNTMEIQAATRTEKVRTLESESEAARRDLLDIRLKIQQLLLTGVEIQSSVKLAESIQSQMSERLSQLINKVENLKSSAKENPKSKEGFN